MKRALVIADADLQQAGLIPGKNYEFVANVHDELQVEVDEDKAETVKEILEASLVKAGEYYNFACPITGGASIGTTWRDTH